MNQNLRKWKSLILPGIVAFLSLLALTISDHLLPEPVMAEEIRMENVVLPPWAEPRKTSALSDSHLTPEEAQKNVENRVAYIQGLYSLPDADKYVFALANTLQVMVNQFAMYEARLPTLEEFLNSPYNNLMEDAWINPYTGERIQWTSEPIRGHLYYSYPSPNDRFALISPLVIVPWIPRFEGVRYEWGGPAPEGATLGIWGTWPGSDPELPRRQRSEFFDRICQREYGVVWYPCHVRRYHAVKMNYSENDWRTLMVTDALAFIFSRIFWSFETGLPASLDEMRQNYWWLYNTNLKNPFTSHPVEEVPFGTLSPGNFVYGSDYQKGIAAPEFIPLGENGKWLYPYDESGGIVTALRNLSSADYIRGLEGRSFCEAAREFMGEEIWEQKGRHYCIDKQLLSTPPRK